MVLWPQNTSCATIFAPILLIAAAIGAILDNVAAVTDATAIGDCFLDHAIKFSHHLLPDHYSKIGRTVHP